MSVRHRVLSVRYPSGPWGRLLADALAKCRRLGIRPSRYVLLVRPGTQRMVLVERRRAHASVAFDILREYLVSTSRYGVGQSHGTNRTPLGLHRIAAKIGGGWPVGTVFEGRRPVGSTWQGMPRAAIAHRILWLEGLEPGFNRGGAVDTYSRYIYVHGLGDELTLGRPASRGCIHLAARDLIALYDRLPLGSQIWIGGTLPAVA